MKALSLLQPWASLVAIGAKRIETRSWSTRYRGPLAIHASAGFPPTCRKLCAEEPFRTVLLGAGLPIWRPLGGAIELDPPLPDWNALPRGQVLAVVTVADCLPTSPTFGSYPFLPEWLDELSDQERAFGNYEEGRWGWHLEDVHRLEPPVPAKGARGLWNWEPSPEAMRLIGGIP